MTSSRNNPYTDSFFSLCSNTRPKKRKRVESIPPNSFPHVVEKGLVPDGEARSLYNIFFSGCHLFIPLFDPAYDTYEGLKERSPFCFDAILTVAAKIRAGGGSPGVAFYRCLEEAQGIARSTLFGPVVRKEAVQGMSSVLINIISLITAMQLCSSLQPGQHLDGFHLGTPCAWLSTCVFTRHSRSSRRPTRPGSGVKKRRET